MTSKEIIKLAMADDHIALQKTLHQNIALFDDLEILYTASNGIDLLKKMNANPILPDVVLMDIDMPQMNGIQATFEIRQKYGDKVKIVILTVFDDDDKIFDAIKAGASGYLMKDERIEKIVEAIKEAMSGGAPMSPTIAYRMLQLLKNSSQNNQTTEENIEPQNYDLTPREIEVLQHLAKGLSYKQIAAHLFLSDKTIKKHIENIYYKLHVNSKMEAVLLAQKYNWVHTHN